MAELIDSYSESNYNLAFSLSALHPSESGSSSCLGQSFTCTTSANITSVKFYLKKIGSPVGNVHAVLYAHSGTYGTSSVPTGGPLATSDDFDISSLSESLQLETFTFTGEEQYEMSSETYYCIVFENPQAGTIGDNDKPYVGADTTSSTHDGNLISYNTSSWNAYSAYDTCFYVYGEAAPVGTNTQINIGDAWKEISAAKINIGDTWKDVAGMQVNIGDAWKTIF